MSDKTEPDHFPKSERGQHDAGEGRELRTQLREDLCLRKLDGGVYCVLTADHHKVCSCVPGAAPRPLAPNDFGPAQAVSTRRGKL